MEEDKWQLHLLLPLSPSRQSDFKIFFHHATPPPPFTLNNFNKAISKKEGGGGIELCQCGKMVELQVADLQVKWKNKAVNGWTDVGSSSSRSRLFGPPGQQEEESHHRQDDGLCCQK